MKKGLYLGSKKRRDIMLKQIRLSLVITVLTFFLTSFAFAGEDAIKPFGGIEWEDGLLDVLAKLNKFDGIEEIKIMKKGEKGVDIKGAIDPKGIAVKMTDVVSQWNKIYMNTPNDHRIKSSPQIVTYVDSNGKEVKCFNVYFTIKTNPILIKNVPFKMEIEFSNAVGLIIHSPDKVITESKGIYTFPLIIKTVTLSSSSPALADHYQEINDTLKSKYKTFNKDFDIDRFKEDSIYNNGVSLNVVAKKSVYSISYTSENFAKKLKETYREHLSTLESEKMKGKKDSSSGL